MLKDRVTFLVLGDIIALVVAYCMMALIRFDVGAQGERLRLQLQLFALIFFLWLLVFFIFDLYNLRRVNPNPRNIGLLVAAMAVNAAIGALLFYLIPTSGIAPKTNLFILVCCAFVLLAAWRRIFYFLFARRFTRSIGIIGQSPLIEHLKEDLAKHPHMGRIVAHWHDEPDIAEDIIDLLIVEAIPAHSLLKLSHRLDTETLSLTEAYETLLGKVPLSLMTDEKALLLVTRRTSSALHAIYRVVEVILASLILILAAPFLLFAVIARLIEDGRPIFYSQLRVGKNGTTFKLYKLRSMIKHAEANGAQWVQQKDARVTPLGRALRKTHLDEVPQMWNIIRGDIALVGPRPERPEFVSQLEYEIPYYFLRHTVRPGFTGWAQIKFRYARTILDSQEKFEYDLYYLKNKGPLFDLGIFVKTLQIIFTH